MFASEIYVVNRVSISQTLTRFILSIAEMSYNNLVIKLCIIGISDTVNTATQLSVYQRNY